MPKPPSTAVVTSTSVAVTATAPSSMGIPPFGHLAAAHFIIIISIGGSRLTEAFAKIIWQNTTKSRDIPNPITTGGAIRVPTAFKGQ